MGHAAIASVLATIFAGVIAGFFGATIGVELAKVWFIAKAASAAPRIVVAVGYKQERVREIVLQRPWVLYSVIALTVAGLLLRFDGFGLFASVGLGLLIIQLWVSAFSAEKRLAREFLSQEQLSHALQLQSQTAERLERTTEQLRREGAVKSMFLGT